MATWTTAVKTWASAALTSTDMNAQVRDFANSFGAWTAYTPAVAGYTSFTYSSSGAYQQTQKLVIGRAQFTIASLTTAGSSIITVSCPVTAASIASGSIVGRVQYAKSGGNVFYGPLLFNSTTTFLMRIPVSTNNYVSTVTGATPASQGASDVWSLEFMYEAA